MEEIDVKKTKYFVIAIIILIVLSIILIIHFNNKKMVSGSDIDTTMTTTKSDIIPITTTVPTTKKVKINNKKEEIKEEIIIEELEKVDTIYKSTIDQNNSLVYNYKLTDEISNNDSIISTKLNISNDLKTKNIIGLYDISLYDVLLNKKSVSNSLINIKIPITDELKGYDDYKVVYINDKNVITNEKFNVKVENNYIEFETTHLSVFGIIGIKNNIEQPEENKPEETLPEVKPEEEFKDIDLSELDVILNINNLNYSYDKDNTLLLSKEDKLNIKVTGIEYNYKIYYSLNDTDYKEYSENILNDIDNNLYNLKVKVVVDNEEVEFELGKVSIYDIIYTNNGDETEESVGNIENEEDYSYDKKDINKDIVIDNGDKVITNTIEEEINNDEKQEHLTIENSQTDNEEVNNDESNNDNHKEDNTNIDETDVKVKINGNIYLVEETDISNLEMTGYLIIDTKENITFDNYDIFNNLYTIIIRSTIFTLNGTEYIYEYSDENIIIKKYVKPDIDTEEDIEKETEVEINIEDFKSIFDNNFNELVIVKDKINQSEEQNPPEETEKIEETIEEKKVIEEQINEETITD